MGYSKPRPHAIKLWHSKAKSSPEPNPPEVSAIAYLYLTCLESRLENSLSMSAERERILKKTPDRRSSFKIHGDPLPRNGLDLAAIESSR
jgi:hypothetical protein